MTLYLKSRLHPSAGSLFLCLLIALVLVGERGVQLPSFIGDLSDDTPIIAILSVALSTILIWSLSGGLPDLEAASTRHVRVLDILFILTIVGIVGLTTLALTTGTAALTATRCLLGFCGSALVSAYFNFRLGLLLPSAIFIIATLVGPQHDGSVAFWAFPIAEPSSVEQHIIAGTLFVAGLITWLRFGEPE